MILALLSMACTAKAPPHLVGQAGEDALLQDARSVRIVGLGESFHGSGVIAETRAHLTRRLIEDGVSILAIEAPMSGGIAIRTWLEGGCTSESASEIVRHLSHPAWQDVSTAELFTWICERKPADPVHILGFDTQDITAIEQLASIVELPRTQIVPACTQKGGATVAPLCRKALEDPRVPEAIRIAASSFAQQWAQTSAVGANNVRDQGMADLFTHLLQGLEGRVVIWAHNAHLNEASDATRTCGKGLARPICRHVGLLRMGTLLADELDVHTVAISGRELSLWRKGDGGDVVWRASRSSAEAALPDEAYVPLDAQWVATVGRSRADLSAAFDALLTVPSGRALRRAGP